MILKLQIIEALSPEDIVPEVIDTELPLFGDDPGIDPTDAPSQVVLPDTGNGIQGTISNNGNEMLFSVRTIADHIQTTKGKP